MALRHYEPIARECPSFFGGQSITVESDAGSVNCPTCLPKMDSIENLGGTLDLSLLRHYEPIARECPSFFDGQSVTVETDVGNVNCSACLDEMKT